MIVSKTNFGLGSFSLLLSCSLFFVVVVDSISSEKREEDGKKRILHCILISGAAYVGAHMGGHTKMFSAVFQINFTIYEMIRHVDS